MSRLVRSLTLLAVGFVLPFAAWAMGTDVNLDPAAPGWSSDVEAVFELPSDAIPPECGLKSADELAEQTDAHPAACCWFFFFGRWWCVAC